MRQISANGLIVGAILAAGALTQMVVVKPLHQDNARFFRTKVLRNFPYSLGGFQGRDIQDSDADLNRKAYQPAEIVYRDYQEGQGEPLVLFVAPVRAGVHAGRYCARYNGYSILQQSDTTVREDSQVNISQMVLVSPKERLQACAYYWRDNERSLQDDPIRLWLKQKADLISGGRENSFLVNVCTAIQSPAEAAAGFARIHQLIAAADPLLVGLFDAAEKEPAQVQLARSSHNLQAAGHRSHSLSAIDFK